MFSPYPFPQPTCSSTPHGHVFPPSLFFHHDTSDENFLLLNQHPFCDPANAVAPSPFIIDNAACSTSNKTAMANQDLVSSCLQLKGDPHCDHLDSVIATKKSTARKDRHSKIFTAQGLRDRRVRLSIEIAGKFFNLQDMLGFDKPSKTLDWLFTNSKTAIQELVEMKNYNLYNSSTSSECELDILIGTKGAAEQIEGAQEVLISKHNPVLIGSNGKEKKIKAHTHKPALHLLAKESRVKARARARERTQENLRIRKLDEVKKQIPDPHVTSNSYPTLNHSIRFSNEIGIPSSKVSAESLSPQISDISLVNYEASWKDIIVEAILAKKPLKSSPTYVYQQNLAVPEEIKVPMSTVLPELEKIWS